MFQLLFLFLFLLNIVYGFDNKPIMGYSTWNAFKRDFDEKDLMDNIDIIVSSGLRDLGYIYFNIDGGWWEGSSIKGNGIIKRNNKKAMLESSEKFPSSMNSFSKYTTKNGLKFGLYTSAAKRSCGGDRPMSDGYEKEDSEQFLLWNVSYMKIDNCGLPNSKVQKKLKLWKKNLPGIYISNCRMGCVLEMKYTMQKFCKFNRLFDMYRTSVDIKPTWASIMNNIKSSLMLSSTHYGMEYSIRDPDMLEVGSSQLSFEEQRSHLALWSITSAPLIISTDLRLIKNDVLQLLKNKRMIFINQNNVKYNYSFKQLIKITKNIDNVVYELYVNNSNKDIQILLLNEGITKDVWTDKTLNNQVVLGPHDSLFIYY